MHMLHTKKFRHGSISVALTVIVIAAVILVNAIFTALSEKYLWYIDMTPEPRFTLSEEAKTLLEQMDESQQVEIILCDEKYAWEMDTVQMEVLKTALDIQNEFSNVKVSYTDIYTNPSSVKAYKELTGKNITQQSVIVTCGSAVRVYNLEDFFALDDNGYVTGYDGEQIFVSSLLSVTQAFSPMACLTSNHGEVWDEGFAKLLQQIGFDVKTVDLSKEELPDTCRLVVIFNPTRDFLEKDGISEISEIDKLEKYLAGNNSMMVFFNKDTPYMQNIEQFLAEWGIEIARTDDNDTPVIRDLDSSLSINGYTNKGVYEEAGTGADITKHMREEGIRKTVAFPNTTALRFASSVVEYSKTYYDGYWCASYTSNGVRRAAYNVFTSSPTAVAMSKGAEVAQASADDPFSYMMLSCQSVINDDTQTISHSFVLACASTDFASDVALDSRYGNASVLSYACNTMGSLVVPVSLDCKYYASMEIAAITSKAATTITVLFATIPTAIVFIAGIYVMIRRKHA